jgi:HEAT repeat protein
MKRMLWMSLALVLAAPLAGSARADGEGGGAPPVQPPAPTKDAEAMKYMKELKPTLSKIADADAKTAIKKLLELWRDKEISDDTRKGIPDLLQYFGSQDKTLIAIEAIDALGECGVSPLNPAPKEYVGPYQGTGPVIQILERSLKAKEPSVDIYGSCLRALKKLADQKGSALKTLLDLMNYKLDDVVGKAADALGGYKEAPGKLRRELLEEIIKKTEGTCASAKDPKNSGQVRKWNIISSNVMGALNALSGQKFKDVQEARKWFNDHKKDKSWDG